jgi:hypothetical protein
MEVSPSIQSIFIIDPGRLEIAFKRWDARNAFREYLGCCRLPWPPQKGSSTLDPAYLPE